MSSYYGAVVAFGLVSLLGYLFWRGTMVVMNARWLVDSGALLVDAGSPQQFSVSHVAGSVNIPAPDVARRQAEIGPWDRPIVVYARSGFRSAAAVHVLRSIGYRQVTNAGPMKRWDVPRSKRWVGDTFPELIGNVE